MRDAIEGAGWMNYTAVAESVADGAEDNPTVTVSEGDFLLMAISGTATSWAGDLRIYDQGSGRNLMNDPCDLASMLGSTAATGTGPRRLEIPHRVKKGSSLALTIKNRSGSSSDYRLIFSGVLVPAGTPYYVKMGANTFKV